MLTLDMYEMNGGKNMEIGQESQGGDFYNKKSPGILPGHCLEINPRPSGRARSAGQPYSWPAIHAELIYSTYRNEPAIA